MTTPLPPLHIDIWVWQQDLAVAQVTDFHALLDEAERTRAARFLLPRDRDRFAVARGRMRQILGQYLGAAPHTLRFEVGEKGKPFLTGGPAFNLSHSAGWAALAVAPQRPIQTARPLGVPLDLPLGLDIQAHRRVEDALARRVFSEVEYAEFSALPLAQCTLGFFQGWSRKEAVIKAVGSGLYTDLRSFDVTLGPGVPAHVLRTTPPLPEANQWQMQDLPTGKGFSGAVAAVTGGASIVVQLREGSWPSAEAP